jgi:hypothetical protein
MNEYIILELLNDLNLFSLPSWLEVFIDLDHVYLVDNG